MAKVATIDGVKIEFYFDEHPPPHFHAKYAEYRAMISIETLDILQGELPRPQYRKVVSWAQTRRNQLREAWNDCRADLVPGPIE